MPARTSITFDKTVFSLSVFLCGVGLVFAAISIGLAIVNASQSSFRSEACPPSIDDESTISSWWGIWLTIIGNLINGFGISAQTYVHRKFPNRPYLCVSQWWIGFVFVVIGETANAVSYGIAPTNIVAPLGAISIIVVDIIAFTVFREQMQIFTVSGAVIIIVGVCLCAYATPMLTELYMASNLIQHILFSSQSVIWFLMLVIFLLLCSLVFNPLFGRKYVIVLAAMSAALSGISVIACRGLFSMVALTSSDCAGTVCYDRTRPPCFETIGSWLFWTLCGVVLITAFVSNGVLEQKGLVNFDQSLFVPVHFGCCTLVFIACGAIVYGDFNTMDSTQIGFFVGGLIAVLLGVAVISGYAPASVLITEPANNAPRVRASR